MEKALYSKCHNPRILIQGKGQETFPQYFPESTLPATMSKVKDRIRFTHP